jgi:hypothetical protein
MGGSSYGLESCDLAYATGYVVYDITTGSLSSVLVVEEIPGMCK